MAEDLYSALGVQPQPKPGVDLYDALGPTGVKQAPENKTNWVEDALHHATFGLSDKAEAVLKASGALSGGSKGETFSDRYHQDLTNVRNDFKDYEAAHPGWSGAKSAKAVGAIAPMTIGAPEAIAAKAAAKTLTGAALRSAATGAGVGAAAGFGSTNDESLGEDLTATGIGALAGSVGGAALPIGLGIAQAPFRAARNAASVFGKEGIETAAGRVLNESKTNGNIFEPAPLPGMQLTTGQSTNDPGLLWLERNVSQATPEGATLFGESMAKNNEAIRKGIGQLGDAGADAGTAMRSAISRGQPEAPAGDQVLELARSHLGSGDFHETVGALNGARKASSAPLYDKAMAGGSIAPLMDQLRSELATATAAKGQIVKQIKAIETNNPGALAARGAAGADTRAKYMDLQNQLKQAEADRVATLEVFRKSQADKASNAPGAVWSPRLQQFLDDPILKSGLSKGLQIQRLEALAEGKKFNPTEYGITGTDAEGQAIVGNVPNMRLLDAAKKGLDNIIEGYRNPITGKLNLDQYGNAVNSVRASYLKELDRLNPDYKAARSAWSGPSQSLDALHAGRNIFGSDPEFTTQRLAGLSPGDLEYYRTGVLRALDDASNNSANGGAALNTLLAKPNVQEKLMAAFGSQEGFQRFRQQAADILNPQTDIGKAVARDRAGNFKLPNSGVADQFIRTGKGAPEAFNAYLDAISTKTAGGKVTYDPDGLKAAQDAFTQKFLSQVSNAGVDHNGVQLVSPAKMQKFLDDYSHVINSPAFTADQRALVQRIAQATKMASRTANARPPGGGSDTFQKLQGDKFIDALVGPGAAKLTGAVSKIGGAAMGALEEGKMGAVMGFLGGEKAAGLLNDLYKAPRDKVVGLITEAMHDPKLAKDLMMKASNSNLKLLPPPRRAKLLGVAGAQASRPVAQSLTEAANPQ